jgi:predicted amidohydrolase YtcJ
MAYKSGFQVNTHAIGDSAVRLMLQLYSSVLKGKNDRRWRIEHAQVVHPNDFQLFADYSIIPSVQPTHATSDMYWAAQRIGNERIKSAYAYKNLLIQNGWMPLGTDFPIESVNPIYTFYAATQRKDLQGFPDTGFQVENALSPQEALYGMTIWAAKASFLETEIGSIEVGKAADFTVLDTDILTTEAANIPLTKVSWVFISGECVFKLN